MKFLGNGISIEYELFGPEGAPTVVVSHSLASSLIMWAPQLPPLALKFQVLCYDTRGHGGTAAPAGKYTLDMLGDDAMALMDGLGLHKVHWVGLSMGGMIGQNIALREASRFNSLTLCDTAAYMPPDGQASWDERIGIVSEQGMEPLADPTMERWFTAGYLAGKPSSVDAIRKQFLATAPAGYMGCCHALKTLDYLEQLPGIITPTMIIVGAEDMGTPVSASEAMQARIPNAQLVVLEEAAHLSNIEQAEGFNAAMMGFLNAQ
ncbi:MAG: 3-oxoadipate enol-lactonase [Alphaproteobacteria bacterium]|jgi:3-oxoadipate enol-lactonase